MTKKTLKAAVTADRAADAIVKNHLIVVHFPTTPARGLMASAGAPDWRDAFGSTIILRMRVPHGKSRLQESHA
jgi:hypothetical protein